MIRLIDNLSGISVDEWIHLVADREPIVSTARATALPNIFLWVRVLSVL